MQCLGVVSSAQRGGEGEGGGVWPTSAWDPLPEVGGREVGERREFNFFKINIKDLPRITLLYGYYFPTKTS